MNLSGGVKTLILPYLGETGGYVLPLSWLGEIITGYDSYIKEYAKYVL